MARLCNFRLTRRMSSGVGGRGWTRFRAEVIIVKAMQRNARLPRRVGGGRRRSERVDNCVFGLFWRRLSLPRASTASRFLSGNRGNDAKWLRYALRKLRGGSEGRAASTTMEDR